MNALPWEEAQEGTMGRPSSVSKNLPGITWGNSQLLEDSRERFQSPLPSPARMCTQRCPHSGPKRAGNRVRGSSGQVPALVGSWRKQRADIPVGKGGARNRPGSPGHVLILCPPPPTPQVPERLLYSDLGEMGKTWSGQSVTPPITRDGLGTPRVTLGASTGALFRVGGT